MEKAAAAVRGRWIRSVNFVVGANTFEQDDLLALVAGAVFIPSLALSLGVWSGSSRLFEITYLLLWYLGPLHPFGMPHLDFMGATDASLSVGAPASFALCAAILLGAAALGRWRQLQG